MEAITEFKEIPIDLIDEMVKDLQIKYDAMSDAEIRDSYLHEFILNKLVPSEALLPAVKQLLKDKDTLVTEAYNKIKEQLIDSTNQEIAKLGNFITILSIIKNELMQLKDE